MFTLGCDPEFFIYDELNNKIKNAEFYIQGTKEKAHCIKDGVFCLLDGVTVEINPKPAFSKQEFIENVLSAKILTELILPENLKLIEITTAKLNEDELTENSRIVGCDPDFNIYTGQENPKPLINNYFFAGGHIHIGCELNDFDKIDLIKHLDKYLLKHVNSLELKYQHHLEKGIRKKVQYGKRGNYRLKPYGIEYRSVSNKWTVNDIEIATVYEIVNDFVKTLKQKSILTF